MQFLDELICAAPHNAYLDVMRQPKLRNMGEYIVKAHLHRPLVSRSPSSPHGEDDAERQRRAAGPLRGTLSGSELACLLCAGRSFYGSRQLAPGAASVWSREESPQAERRDSCNFCWGPPGDARRKVRYPALGALPDLQLFVLREQPENEFRGTILTLKGGHNAEGHNHIDVGQFELFRDGAPVIVDTGTMCYDRFTFNERRYERWCYNAEENNLPQINGVVQLDGGEYKATVLAAEPGCVELELCDAYPAGSASQADPQSQLCPDGAATITDTLRPAGIAGTVRLPLYSAVEPVKRPDGKPAASVPSSSGPKESPLDRSKSSS
ncbi:MAG: heparinase II/III family protein [Victivallis sp.]